MKLRFLPLLALFLPACGSLWSNPDSAPPVTTIRGTVANPSSLVLDGSVRIAVEWQGGAPFGGTTFTNAADETTLNAVFPSSFTLGLSTLPPDSAMTDYNEFLNDWHQDAGAGTEDFKYATGVIVAYIDKNNNGSLDLVARGAPAYIDEIVGKGEHVTVAYLEGSPNALAPMADLNGLVPKPGFNLWFSCERSAAVDDGSLCGCTSHWAPMDAPIEITLASKPENNALMCQLIEASSITGGSTTHPTGQPAQYPDACDPNVRCAANGSSYTYETCTAVDVSVCEGYEKTCDDVMYERPSPTPAGWPCTH